MTTLNANWLDNLVNHPIFELKEAEKRFVEKSNVQTTRNENSTADFLLQHHNQVIALQDNNLFVAVGSTIRVLNLAVFKDSWLKADNKLPQPIHYKVLDTPDINFAIDSLIPNKNGSLLAVKGKNRLSIVCLPRHDFADISQLSQKKVECRTLSVGTTHYNNSVVVKLQWHPLSESGTHLVVLDDNSVLRIFDISVDLDEPEQYFDLFGEKPQSTAIGGFSFSRSNIDKNEDVVSFALGGPSRDQSGWEPYTVFYTLRNGNIYALSPVIPYKSCVRRGHLKNLASITKAKYEEAKNSESSDGEVMSYLLKLQLYWINILFKSAKILHKTTSNNVEGSILSVSSEEHHSIYPVQRQGPFVSNQTTANGEIADILYINVEPVRIIVLAFTNGTIQNYILCTDINPQWKIPSQEDSNVANLGSILSNSDYVPKVSLVETINLKSHDLPMTLIADPLYEDTYFVYHATGVHAVSTIKWVHALRKINASIESGNETEAQHALDSWVKDPTQSDVKLLVDSSPFSNGFVPIVGLVVISDLYLSYSLLTITIDYQLITTELFIRRESRVSKKSQEAVKESLKHVVDELDSQSLLSLPVYQVPPQLESLPSQSKVVIPADIGVSKDVVVNEETLEFLEKFSSQIQSESKKIEQSVTKLYSRLTSQQCEFQRQVKSLRDLNDRFQKHASSEAKDALEKKIKKLIEGHTKLRSRINQQACFFMRSSEQELSDDEISWIEKIETLSEQVNIEGGYAKRVNELKSQLNELKSGTDRIKSGSANVTQFRNTLRTLKEKSSIIKEVHNRVKALETQVSSSAT